MPVGRRRSTPVARSRVQHAPVPGAGHRGDALLHGREAAQQGVRDASESSAAERFKAIALVRPQLLLGKGLRLHRENARGHNPGHRQGFYGPSLPFRRHGPSASEVHPIRCARELRRPESFKDFVLKSIRPANGRARPRAEPRACSRRTAWRRAAAFRASRSSGCRQFRRPKAGFNMHLSVWPVFEALHCSRVANRHSRGCGPPLCPPPIASRQ